ncbi:MAG: hypothetical protein UX91_C0006G0197 [Candidatus Amesbacteria bacterium GW2011_GWB1_47_19]|nr:MAG: hypothetical protein UW51_C0002G0198 [Candidatus Amesbacteria bacterium GW2011_GWA1_44_24]KKU31211.1 MAG: hypothetical protein UX46_C0006G0003 [Candidatus Amesbacteria bacterium GW2011_GWC1_46_24]KKU67135.1 MAG: hypothetical protein UX91_C0006G0197 [Candidatus Amesbacteria bacterium GW2011_GWB1_47_19]HBC73005.1 hypothetical protein [Candidatus Amesbacteria bacterium]
MNWIIPDNPPPNPDCFIILSYALKDKSTPTRPTRALIEFAAKLQQKFPNAKIIMSTGDNQKLGVSNAAVMAAYARSRGVPAANIIKEDRSLTTFENLLFSREIVRRRKLRQPCLITLDLHTRRAVATAKKMDWTGLYWFSVYSPGEPASGWKSIQTYSRATIFIYEILAIFYSEIKGWI